MGDPDSSRKDQAGIANEGADASVAAEQEAQRAYPADSVPDIATSNSQATFASLSKHGNGPGAWQSIGPSQAKYPALLDQFLAGGKEYTASGRVTAMAIGGCKDGDKCSLYIGAAGGGVWVANKATDRKRAGELAVQVGLLRHERDRRVARRSVRLERQHGLRRHR